jgi:hypothetical protein
MANEGRESVMSDIVIEYECSSCYGTGLYHGYFEKDGAAVVCHCCNGTGKCTFRAKPFTGQKVAKGVKRVFDSSHGYVISAKDITTKDGVELPFSQWGCTYGEWLAGATPVPMKGLACPYQHDNRGMGNEPLGDKCRDGNTCFSLISDCPHYSNKEKCWEELEAKTSVHREYEEKMSRQR